jgi:hypothetical protein
MKVTEHNISDWRLNESEIDELVRLVKEEMEMHSDNKAIRMFYGMIVGKLIIMRSIKK